MGLDIDFSVKTNSQSETIYFRKANHIHGWIIKNCADGEDDCTPILIEKESFYELKKICQNIVNSVTVTEIEILDKYYDIYHYLENCYADTKFYKTKIKDFAKDNYNFLIENNLLELLKRCNTLIKSRNFENSKTKLLKLVYKNYLQVKLQEILPTSQGCFFGTEIYNSDLIDQCKEFVEFVNLFNKNDDLFEINYEASW